MLKVEIVNNVPDDAVEAGTSLMNLINWNGETADELCSQEIVRGIFDTYIATCDILRLGSYQEPFVVYVKFNDVSTNKAIRIEGDCDCGIDRILGACEIDKVLRKYIGIVGADVDDNIKKMFDFIFNSWSHHGSVVLGSAQRQKSIVIYDKEYVDPKALITMIFMTGAVVFFDLQSVLENPERYTSLQSMFSDNNIEFYSGVIFEDVDEIKEFFEIEADSDYDLIYECNENSNIYQIYAAVLKQELIKLRYEQRHITVNSANADAFMQFILNLFNNDKGDNDDEDVTEKAN